MDVETQTLQNTADIGKLTGLVAELATTARIEFERMKEDRAGVKDMVAELKGLNDKISSMAGVQKEMAQNAKDVTELRTRVDQLKEWKDKYDLSAFNSRIATLETAKEREEGASKALSTGANWLWMIFGPVVTAVIVGGLTYYFSHVPYYSHETTTIEHTSHEPITGE